MKRLPFTLGLILTLSTVTGCATAIPGDFCRVYQVETFTEREWAALSEETKRPILKNQAYHMEVCR